MQFISILLFPEFLLTIGILFILFISTYIKNSFKFSLYSSIILLITIALLIFFNNNINYLNYNYLFSSNLFIKTFKIFIISSSIICLLISENYFKDLELEKYEIPILILFSILGMFVMISSNNLMSLYLGAELQSLPLYVIASIQKKSLKSSEAGLKYFVLGTLSSGILLYGCSLIYGFIGSTDFNTIQIALSNISELNIGIIFGLVFILVGLSFKVSAVPFHMWTPDVYEGSPTPITAYFIIVPKIAAIGLFIRFLIEPFGDFWLEWKEIIIFISIGSMIIGSLAAILQNNIKRLLAYSSIGHVGYMLIGLAAGSESGIRGMIIYVSIYIIMNIAIFSVLLSMKVKNKYIENINDISGLSKKNPIISIVLTLAMFSMAGIPPLAGFFGKFYIFIAALESKLFILAITGVLTSVIAAFYYIRIIKVIFFDEPVNEFEMVMNIKVKFIIFMSTLFITFFIVYPSIITNIANKASYTIFY